MHNSFLMYLPSASFANNDDLGLLHVVWGTKYDALASIVAFENMLDLNWTAKSLASAVEWLSYRYSEGTVFTVVNCPLRDWLWRDPSLVAMSQAKRAAAEFFYLVYGAHLPVSFDGNSPLVQSGSTSPSTPSDISPVATDKTSSSSLEFCGRALWLSPLFVFAYRRQSV